MEPKQPEVPKAADEKQDQAPDDAANSDRSSSTQFTPRTGFTFGPPPSEYASSVHHTALEDVPWYGKTYMILDKQTRKAITLEKHDGISLSLKECEDGPNSWNTWLCVCKNNYTAFQSKRSGRYIGHDGKEIGGKMHTVALKLDEWGSFIPRLHPDGGYQLLSPFWGKHLMLLVKTSGGEIARGHHGDTLWVFEEV